MKSRKQRRRNLITRIGVASSLFVFGGTNTLVAFGSQIPAPNSSHQGATDMVAVEDEEQAESPILELDPERKYKSEAVLSYKSSLAPYGKIVGIRLESERAFKSVQNWKDVEEFIAGIAEDKVVVKLTEPWGSEVISTVSVNRKAYPASRIRPAGDPPKPAAQPEAPKPKPDTKPQPKPDQAKPVVLTNLPEKPELRASDPSPEAVTAKPSQTRIGDGGSTDAPLEAKLIEPKQTSTLYVKAELGTTRPNSKASVSQPSGAKSPAGNSVTSAEPRLVEPNAGLMATHSSPNVPLGKPIVARRAGPGAASKTNAKLIEPTLVATEAGYDPYELIMLASLPFMPSQESPAQVKFATAEDTVSVVPVATTAKFLAKAGKKPVVVTAEIDDTKWLDEAIELADKLGVLACKPVITSDRRQRAFALYTLYMGLKDYHTEVLHRADRLNSALRQVEGKASPSQNEMDQVVALGRSYERAYNTILKWDVDVMKAVVKGYTVELRGMDSVNSMLAFLSGMKQQPKLVTDIRTISGLEQVEE